MTLIKCLGNPRLPWSNLQVNKSFLFFTEPKTYRYLAKSFVPLINQIVIIRNLLLRTLLNILHTISVYFTIIFDKLIWWVTSILFWKWVVFNLQLLSNIKMQLAKGLTDLKIYATVAVFRLLKILWFSYQPCFAWSFISIDYCATNYETKHWQQSLKNMFLIIELK